MDSHVDSGSNLTKMAEAILLLSKQTNQKYIIKLVPFTEIFHCIKRILPDTMYEKMLMKHYKL